MRVDLDAFEERYATSEDPWDFATSPYEQLRYTTTLDALPRPRYARAFEPGCSVGVLTARLAERADQLVAYEASPTAAAVARERLVDAPHVKIEHASIPERWPDGTFDLIVFSELGYYWDEQELADIVDELAAHASVDGDLVAVHWTGRSPDHLLTGDEVHAALRRRLGTPTTTRRLTAHGDSFLLDVFRLDALRRDVLQR